MRVTNHMIRMSVFLQNECSNGLTDCLLSTFHMIWQSPCSYINMRFLLSTFLNVSISVWNFNAIHRSKNYIILIMHEIFTFTRVSWKFLEISVFVMKIFGKLWWFQQHNRNREMLWHSKTSAFNLIYNDIKWLYTQVNFRLWLRDVCDRNDANAAYEDQREWNDCRHGHWKTQTRCHHAGKIWLEIGRASCRERV